MAGLASERAPAERRVSASSSLKTHTVTVAGRRTSMRFEQAMWEALREVCAREQLTASALVTAIAAESLNGALTAAVRVFLLCYFRTAATNDGHRAAGHGMLPRRFAARLQSPL